MIETCVEYSCTQTQPKGNAVALLGQGARNIPESLVSQAGASSSFQQEPPPSASHTAPLADQPDMMTAQGK